MSCNEINRSHYYRDVDVDGDPIIEAIEELQEDVERIDAKDLAQDGRMDGLDNDISGLNNDISGLDDRLDDLEEWKDNFSWHTHQSNVAKYYCASYGDDSNDGSREHPFRSLIPIFDPAHSKVNLQDTAIRIDFLDAGGYYAFEEYQEWPWFNGVFIRFYGPKRTSMPVSPSEMPTIVFNCHAISFSNSYIGTDYVSIRVNDGTYDEEYGQNYNRMHLNNTSLISTCTYFNESRTSPHCGNASFVDCQFNKFSCSNCNVEFSRSLADNLYSFTALKADTPQSPLNCNSSIVRFDGPLRFQQPTSNLTKEVIYNHGSVMCFGGDIGYYGAGTGKYKYGIATTYGINLLTTDRWNHLATMGTDGNSTGGSLRVASDTVIP